MSMLMDGLASLGALVVGLTWAWFFVFPLVVVLIGLGQVARGTAEGYAASGVAGALEELRQVLCPVDGKAAEVLVLVRADGPRVTRCSHFGNGVVSCAQACLART